MRKMINYLVFRETIIKSSPEFVWMEMKLFRNSINACSSIKQLTQRKFIVKDSNKIVQLQSSFLLAQNPFIEPSKWKSSEIKSNQMRSIEWTKCLK